MSIPRSSLQCLRSALRRAPIRTKPRIRSASYQRFPTGPGGKQSSGPYSNFAPYARLQYIWRNYRRPVLVAGTGGGVFYVYNLEEVPITHRRRFNFISPETEKAIGSDAAYQQTLAQFKNQILPENHPYTQTVAKIVSRLVPSAHGLAGADWRVHVIDDPNMVNAFVLPGGKVFVFTGLFPIAKDENGLAAVIGHEIGHNVAHHVAERLSRQGLTILGALILSSVLDISGSLGNNITDLVLTLPNGRTQETEADHIGLLMMAEACYDPRHVPDLWKRMYESERKHGGAPPQFLSTHPSSASRGETIEKWMPEAMELYNQNDCSITGRSLNEFRQLTGIKTNIRDAFSMAFPSPQQGRVARDDDDDFF